MCHIPYRLQKESALNSRKGILHLSTKRKRQHMCHVANGVKTIEVSDSMCMTVFAPDTRSNPAHVKQGTCILIFLVNGLKAKPLFSYAIVH